MSKGDLTMENKICLNENEVQLKEMRTLTLEEDKESLEGSVVFEVDLGKWSEHTRGRGHTGSTKGDTWETEL